MVIFSVEIFVTIFVFDFIINVILCIVVGVRHVSIKVLLAFRQELDGIGSISSNRFILRIAILVQVGLRVPQVISNQ